SHAHSASPHLHPADAPASAQTTRHHLARSGRLLRPVHSSLWPPQLPLPPRRPPPRRPTPHLQGGRQDPLRLRPQGTARPPPPLARRTQAVKDPPPRDPPPVGGPAAGAGPAAQAEGGTPLVPGRALGQTVRPFFPQ